MRPTNVLLFLVLVLLVAAPASAAHTTQVQVIRYASDGTTVANQTTVDVAWMESNLPVFGDGVTPYLFQGPLTEISDYSNPAKWNPAEDNNVDKVNETIKGTYVTDLCNLVGGMQTGGVVKVVASDGFAKTFAYDNVYSPQARQGPMVLAWWTAREGYAYNEGIRLFFGADTSTNPYGLHVFGNQDMKETFDEKYWGWYGGKDALPSAAQLSNKWVAKVEIFPAPSSDWSVLLNGSIKRDITKSYFESGLAWAGHRASYTDATGGVWEGMPLWRLIGYVDDGNEHSDLAFNRTLAEQGYTIRVIAADGYNRAFSSQDVAFSSNYIVANTLNGSALPVQINGKNVWPLRLIGTNATGGKSVSNITEIRVEGVPEPVPTTVPTTSVSDARGPALDPEDDRVHGLHGHEPVPRPRPWPAAGTPGRIPMRTASSGWACRSGGSIGLVDDQLGHEVLIGAFNATLAAQGYVVRVIAADGYNRTFTSQEVKPLGDYLLASRMNGSALPEQVNGKYYWPLKLVGSNATGGKSIGNITEIRLENLPIAPPPAADRPWTLKMTRVHELHRLERLLRPGDCLRAFRDLHRRVRDDLDGHAALAARRPRRRPGRPRGPDRRLQRHPRGPGLQHHRDCRRRVQQDLHEPGREAVGQLPGRVEDERLGPPRAGERQVRLAAQARRRERDRRQVHRQHQRDPARQPADRAGPDDPHAHARPVRPSSSTAT